MTTQISKRENELKEAYWQHFRTMVFARHYHVVQHQDVRTAGNPDSHLSGFGGTSFWEFKHATPNFSTSRVQEETCVKLDRVGYICRYVIFYEPPDADNWTILVVNPALITGIEGKLSPHTRAYKEAERFQTYGELADYMHKVHRAVQR